MAGGEAPKASCPRTGLTIPECSCDTCLEGQIRRFMPALLEPGPRSSAAPSNAAPARRRRWHKAA